MNEDNLREKLYDVTEDFYSMLSSNEPVNVMDKLDEFVDQLHDIAKSENQKRKSYAHDINYLRMACSHRDGGIDAFTYDNGICKCKICGIEFRTLPLEEIGYEKMTISRYNKEISDLDILENLKFRALGNKDLSNDIVQQLNLYYSEKPCTIDRELYDRAIANFKAKTATSQELYSAARLLKNYCINTKCSNCRFFVEKTNKCRLETKGNFHLDTSPRDWDV